jgi:outer membrane immunogenic protein
MNKKLLLAALMVSTATGVSAQSKFEGFYAQAGIGYEMVSPSLSFGNLNITNNGSPVASVPTSSTINTSNSFAGTITAGYNFAINKDFLLGFGAEYSPIAGSKANYSATYSGYGTANGQYNKENSYNIFISPATPVGNDGLLYGKVGYTGASVKSQCDGCNSTTDNLTGYSLGLGYKQIISGGLYGFGEVNYASYSNKSSTDTAVFSTYRASQTSTVSANVTNFLVGVGYKF